jgi:hypothetical protein
MGVTLAAVLMLEGDSRGGVGKRQHQVPELGRYDRMMSNTLFHFPAFREWSMLCNPRYYYSRRKRNVRCNISRRELGRRQSRRSSGVHPTNAVPDKLSYYWNDLEY